MFFWQHDGNLDTPPQMADIRRRRPWGKHYWESTAMSINDAILTFYRQFKRETGRDPGTPPYRNESKCEYAMTRRCEPKRGAGQTKDKPR